MRPAFFFFLSVFLLSPLQPLAAESSLLLHQPALQRVYSGGEIMHFSISWSGGIKIGDLYLSMKETGQGLAIKARVTDYGLFRLFYPVDDSFTTYVQRPGYLPFRYEVHQKEGGSMDVHRQTLYDQVDHVARYRKNTNPVKTFSMGGAAYNEFSSFYITRVLQLIPDLQQIVPTFVDEKRHQVAVKVFGVEPRKTIFGTMDTIKVMPLMNFKGLYDKDGDTVFWLTDDACRIPVEINSRILIGSLVAELVDYTNPACQRQKKKPSASKLSDDDLL